MIGVAARDGVVLGADRRFRAGFGGSGPYLDDCVCLRPYGDRSVIGYCGSRYAAKGVSMDAFLDSAERKYGTDVDVAELPYLLRRHFNESGCDDRNVECVVGGIGSRDRFCLLVTISLRLGFTLGQFNDSLNGSLCQGAHSIAKPILRGVGEDYANWIGRNVEDAEQACRAALEASAVGYGLRKDCSIGGHLDLYVIRTNGRHGWLSDDGLSLMDQPVVMGRRIEKSAPPDAAEAAPDDDPFTVSP